MPDDDDLTKFRAPLDPPATEPPPAPEPPPSPTTKTISLVVDHVFMPEDLTAEGWSGCETTKKYLAEADDTRAKYEVHHGLADFLVKRKQAVEVLPDKG